MILEPPLDMDAVQTADVEAIESDPPNPRAGDRNPPRFKPRTNGRMVDAVPAEPEAAALTLGLTGPAEAQELWRH